MDPGIVHKHYGLDLKLIILKFELLAEFIKEAQVQNFIAASFDHLI